MNNDHSPERKEKGMDMPGNLDLPSQNKTAPVRRSILEIFDPLYTTKKSCSATNKIMQHNMEGEEIMQQNMDSDEIIKSEKRCNTTIYENPDETTPNEDNDISCEAMEVDESFLMAMEGCDVYANEENSAPDSILINNGGRDNTVEQSDETSTNTFNTYENFTKTTEKLDGTSNMDDQCEAPTIAENTSESHNNVMSADELVGSSVGGRKSYSFVDERVESILVREDSTKADEIRDTDMKIDGHSKASTETENTVEIRKSFTITAEIKDPSTMSENNCEIRESSTMTDVTGNSTMTNENTSESYENPIMVEELVDSSVGGRKSCSVVDDHGKSILVEQDSTKTDEITDTATNMDGLGQASTMTENTIESRESFTNTDVIGNSSTINQNTSESRNSLKVVTVIIENSSSINENVGENYKNLMVAGELVDSSAGGRKSYSVVDDHVESILVEQDSTKTDGIKDTATNVDGLGQASKIIENTIESRESFTKTDVIGNSSTINEDTSESRKSFTKTDVIGNSSTINENASENHKSLTMAEEPVDSSVGGRKSYLVVEESVEPILVEKDSTKTDEIRDTATNMDGLDQTFTMTENTIESRKTFTIVDKIRDSPTMNENNSESLNGYTKTDVIGNSTTINENTSESHKSLIMADELVDSSVGGRKSYSVLDKTNEAILVEQDSTKAVEVNIVTATNVDELSKASINTENFIETRKSFTVTDEIIESSTKTNYITDESPEVAQNNIENRKSFTVTDEIKESSTKTNNITDEPSEVTRNNIENRKSFTKTDDMRDASTNVAEKFDPFTITEKSCESHKSLPVSDGLAAVVWIVKEDENGASTKLEMVNGKETSVKSHLLIYLGDCSTESAGSSKEKQSKFDDELNETIKAGVHEQNIDEAGRPRSHSESGKVDKDARIFELEMIVALDNEKFNMMCAEKKLINEQLKAQTHAMNKSMREIDIFRDKYNQLHTHIAKAEDAFSDVHSKYSRAKQVIEEYRNMEGIWKNDNALNEASIVKYKEKYTKLRTYADEKMKEYNLVILNERKLHDRDARNFSTTLKRMQIKIRSLEQQVEQKTKECEELSSLCNEFTPRKK